MTWLWVGVAAWVAITTVAIAFGKAAAKPWPKQQRRYQK